MIKPDLSIIDKDWPAEDLERVDACPFCDSKKRQLAHHDVRDWSFFAAPGRWDYWECADCHCLYLDPRPTEASIGRAYSHYYTHDDGRLLGLNSLVKRIKNTYISMRFNISLKPNFNFPRSLSFLLGCLKPFVFVPFELTPLMTLPKGRLLDIGCGGGFMMRLAKLVGWEVVGLEIDPDAVKFARSKDLNVIEGGVDALKDIDGHFDCVICSHVLEHVYQPDALLNSIKNILREDGTLLLSLPNAGSDVRAKYGRFWRGLEAPRHIAIPELSELITRLKYLGFVNVVQYDIYGATVAESARMERGLPTKSFASSLIFKIRDMLGLGLPRVGTDFIQIVAKRS